MGWTRAQALAFLAPVGSLSEIADADELAAALHDNPVALHLARSFLEQHPAGTARYRQEIRPRRPGGDPVPAQIALARAQLGLSAWHLARAVAYLAAEPLRSDWARALVPDGLGGADAATVAGLRRYGLISLSQDGELLRMHPTIQATVRAADPRHRGAWLGARPLMDAYASAEDLASWPLCEHLDGHAQRFTEHVAGIRRMRSIRQTLLRELGDYARFRGRSERAALLYEVALGLAGDRDARGELHYRLGLALKDDQPEAARDNLRQAVTLAVRAHGAGHPAIARNRHALSHAYERLGELVEARQELEQALREGEAHLGPDDLNLAVGRTTLGDLLRQEGDLERSKEVLEGALAELMAAAGPDDLRVTAGRAGLAKTYVALGDPASARDQLEQALAADLRLVGADHPYVRGDQAQLDEVLAALGVVRPDDSPPAEAPADAYGWLLEPSAVSLDRTAWRWRLTGPDGVVRAEHEVTLDPAAAEYQALVDLDSWLRWRPAPDRRRSDERRLIKELGEWIGGTVLGPVTAALAGLPAGGGAVTVRVRIPPEASWLPAYALELAIPPGGGEPLALLPIRLVYEVASAGAAKQPAGRPLRVLAILSTPSGGVTLDLRSERRALERLAAAQPDRVDLVVLQYGCTLERLTEAVADPRGWDILHLAGHGGPGELVLETDDGAPHPVPAAELLRILDAARDRVRLLIASWCSSALDDALSVLELEAPGELAADPIDAPVVSGLGARLAARLGCTVLAMRHPVGDSLSVRLAEEIYPRLLATQPSAWEAAVAAGIGPALRGTTPLRPLWLAAPVLFTAGPPPGTPGLLTAGLHAGASDAGESVAEIAPDGPADVFTGRVGLLARLRHAGPAVVLSGLPGIGKTACAQELAWMIGDGYRRTVWHGPDELGDIAVGDHELVVVDGLAGPWTERQGELVTGLARQAAARSGRLVVTVRSSPPAGLPDVTATALMPLAPAEAAWMVRQRGLATGDAARQLLAECGGVPGLIDGSTDREEVAAWARHEFASMSPEERSFLGFLCALEADDRDTGAPVEMLWDPVRRELTGEDVDASAAPHVAELVRRGLAAVDGPPVDWAGAWGARLSLPVLDAAGALLDEDTATLVATWANEYWTFQLEQFRERGTGDVAGATVYTGRRIVPYRLRLRDWHGVRAMLGLIWQHDPAPDLAPAIAARLRRSGPQPGGDPEALSALLSELEARSSTRTEADLRAAIERAETGGDPGEAAELGFDLINLLVLAGRAEDALPMAERLPELGRAGGADRLRMSVLHAQRPQVLVAAGRFEEGLAEAERQLKAQQAGHIAEGLHNIAFRAAMKLKRFPVALEHSEAIAAGLVRRHAPELEQARELLNTALVRRDSGRPDLARQLVLRAREVFEAAGDVEGLIAARVSLAELEAREGRLGDAVRLARDVLRLEYTSHPTADPADRRLAHLNLSAFLVQARKIGDEALCHLVAAALIDGLTGSWRTPQTLETLQGVAARYEILPSSLEELDRQLATTPGVRFLEFVATLPGGLPAAEEAFRELRPFVRYAPENAVLDLIEQMGLPVAYVDLETGETIEPDGPPPTGSPTPAGPPTLAGRIGRWFLRR